MQTGPPRFHVRCSISDISGTLKIAAGSYSIWTIPDAKEWTLIVNKQTGQFHLDYDDSTDFGHTKMNMKKLDTPVETFRIEVAPTAKVTKARWRLSGKRRKPPVHDHHSPAKTPIIAPPID